MTMPRGRSGSRAEDTSSTRARPKTSSSLSNPPPRDSLDLLRRLPFTQHPLPSVIPPVLESRSGTIKRSRSLSRKKTSDEPDDLVGNQDRLVRSDPPWRTLRNVEPQSAKASFSMDEPSPRQYASPRWDETPHPIPMRPSLGQVGIEQPRPAVSRAFSYPDAGRRVEPGTTSGRWHLLGGLFARKSAPSLEPSPPTSALGSPRAEIHIEGGTVERPSRATSERSRGRFRSRSRKDPVKYNSKRANTEPIRTTDISNPVPTAGNDQNHGQTSRDCGSTKPVLDVEIPSVKLERYSVMFGNLLENHSSGPSLSAGRQKNVDRLKSIESGHDDVARCQTRLDPLNASDAVKQPLATSDPCLSTLRTEHDSAFQPEPDPNPLETPSDHDRPLTTSTVVSSRKAPNAYAQHLVFMVHRPRRISSLQPRQISSTEPYGPPPSSYRDNFRTAPSSSLERVDLGRSKHDHTQDHKSKAEISVARRVSMTRQRHRIQHLPGGSARTQRLADGSRVLTPRVMQMQRRQSRRSQRGLLEVA